MGAWLSFHLRNTIAERTYFRGESVRHHKHYNKGEASQENLDSNIKPLSLTGQDAGGYCRLLEEHDWQANGNEISATPYALMNNFLIN